MKSGDALKIPAARFSAFADAAAKAIVKKPVAAYAGNVWEEGDLSGLGIGT